MSGGESGARRDLTWFVFAGLAVVAFAVLMYAGRELLFFIDELIWIRERRDPTLDSLLQPHGGHLSVLPVAVFQLLFHTVGIENYEPYRVVVLVVHVACVALVFAYLRRRISPWLALGPVAVLLFFGAAWQDLLWPFQLGFLLSVTAGVGALLLLDRSSRRADLGAAGCVSVGLASSSIGIPIAGGVGLELLLRRAWHRLWLVVVPIALYLVWYVVYSDTTTFPSTVVEFTRFVVEAAGAALGAITGAGDVVGQWLLPLLLALVVWGFLRADSARRPRIVVLAAIPVAYWCLLAYTRAGFQPASSSRYLYPGAVFIVLLIGESLVGVRLARAVVVIGALVVVWAVVWNLGELQKGRDVLLPITEDLRVQLGALEIAGESTGPGYRPVDPPPRDVEEYLEAFDAAGTPGSSAAEIRRESERRRRSADAFLARALGLGLERGDAPVGGAAPAVERGSSSAAAPSCVVLSADATGVDAEVAASDGGVLVRSGGGPTRVFLRAFGDGPWTGDVPFGTVRAGESAALRLPPTDAGPWHVELESPTAVEVCTLAP